jgi:hypothetical protein
MKLLAGGMLGRSQGLRAKRPPLVDRAETRTHRPHM